MCVRYNTIDERWERWVRRRNVWEAVNLPPKQHQMFPGRVGHIARMTEGGKMEMVEATWGLQPFWAKVPTFGARNCYNARVEGSENPKPNQKPGIEHMASFREPFKKRRCLVPIASYYESADVEEARAAGRYVEVFPTEDEGFWMAGLWEEPNEHTGGLPTFTIVTTASNGPLAEIHSRRLARLDEDAVDAWLHSEAPVDLLKAIVRPRDEEPIRLETAEPPPRAKRKAVPVEETLF